VNSVIDIIDTIDSEYYQLIGSKGYVRKVLGVGWYWRTLPRERYMVYNTTEKEEEEELESNSDDVPPPLDDIRLSKVDDHGYTREKASSNNNSSSSSISSRPSISSSVAGSNVSAEPTPDQSSVSYLFAMLLQNIISIDKARKNLFHVSYNCNAAAVAVDDDRQLKVQLKLSELRIEYMSLLKHALILLAQTASPLRDVVLTCEEVYIDEVDSCQVTGTFDVSHLTMDTAASIQSAVHQSTDNKEGVGGGGGGGGYLIHWLPMAANRTLSKQLEELRNSSSMLRLLPSQRIAVFTFYYLFDVINEILTKNAEIMIANESSSSSSQGSSAVALHLLLNVTYLS